MSKYILDASYKGATLGLDKKARVGSRAWFKSMHRAYRARSQ